MKNLATQGGVPVCGYLARNWQGANEDTPAVITNPHASPLDLLAWCWGEVASLEAVTQSLTTAEGVDAGDLQAIYLQRLQPLGAVLYAAVSALAVQARAQRQASDAGRA